MGWIELLSTSGGGQISKAIGSLCCATSTATACPRCDPFSSTISTRHLGSRWLATISMWRTPTPSFAIPIRTATPRSPPPAPSSPTFRAVRSIITGPRAFVGESRWLASSMSASARTATSARTACRRNQPRRDLGGRSGNGRAPHLRHRPAQSQRAAMGAAERQALGRRQRTRRTRSRPGSGLSDVGAGRRLLWLALQLLWAASGPARLPQRPDLVAKAIVPDYALSSHVAPLGLALYGATLPATYRGGAFVGEHGSWDRSTLNGYKVVFVPFNGGRPSGLAQDFVTGFLTKDDHARGRPVGLAVDNPAGC